MEQAQDRDESPIFAQFYRADVLGAYWIPATLLIESGRFRRMQEWREELHATTTRANFYCFVSHRWLTPTHPDPEGLQARFFVWQIFAHLCAAVRTASLRD